jgi:RimJ/RimL family protein N-acetyltransferase
MNPILIDLPEEIETERLVLRIPRAGDGEVLAEAVNESLNELKLWMPWARQEVSVEAEEAVARRARAEFVLRENFVFVIIDKASGKLAGGTGLHRFDWDVPRFEIGYWVRTCFAGKGYISESVNALTDFCFRTLRAERVEIRMDDSNEKSWRVAERCNFKLEGILRSDALAVNGTLRDTRVYSKIRSEWVEGNDASLSTR